MYYVKYNCQSAEKLWLRYNLMFKINSTYTHYHVDSQISTKNKIQNRVYRYA